VDSGDTKTVSAVNDVGANVNNSVAGTYGSVVIHADGSYTYTLNNADPDTNALAQDASVDDVFNYTMQDASGAASSSTLTISITGTNDAPVANPDTNRGDPVTEAGVHPGNTVFADDDTAVGDVLANDTDVDFGDTKTVTAVNGSPGSVFDPVHGAYGSVIIRDDGSWIYTLDNTDPDTNALAQGASATDIFRYTMEDANGASSSSTLTIHITGTNDAPVANPDDATAVDDGNVTLPDAIGNVLGNDRDPDTGDILMGVTAVNGNPNVVGDPVRGTYGSVNILDDGSWKYYLNDHATDALARGTSADDVFAYTTEDANGASSSSTLTIHVTGTGAAPVVTSLTSTAGNLSVTGGASAGGGNNAPVAVADEAIFKTTGTSGNVLANDFDPDTGDSLVVTGVSTSGNPGTLFDPFDPVHGTYGSITIRDDGSWDYTLDKNDPDTNALAQGASVDDVFGYTIEDPYGATASSTLLIHIDVL